MVLNCHVLCVVHVHIVTLHELTGSQNELFLSLDLPGPRERGPGVHCLRVGGFNSKFLVKLFVIYQLEPV